MTEKTREEYYQNMLTIIHQAIIDDNADVWLMKEQWQELSEITGLPYPYLAPVVPFEPDAEDLKRLEEFSGYNNRPITKVEYY